MLDECQTKTNQRKIHECSMEESKNQELYQTWESSIRIENLVYDDNSQDVTLVSKTPVIAKVNNSKLDIINNERYTVKKIDIDARHLTIQNDRNEIVIHAENFQKLFRIGYAFTTHSSQGMSIDKPYTIHEFNRISKKLKYVALSRSTKHEYINIM